MCEVSQHECQVKLKELEEKLRIEKLGNKKTHKRKPKNESPGSENPLDVLGRAEIGEGNVAKWIIDFLNCEKWGNAL